MEAHEEFAGRVATGFTPGAVNNNGAPFIAGDTHGVACAGVIGATHDNLMGIRGVAPNVTLVPVNILTNSFGGSFTTMEIATAITWAASNADILSNSWGFSGQYDYSFDIDTAFTGAMTWGRGGLGAVVVFASGNQNQLWSGVTFPARLANIITVGAVDKSASIWNYSSRGGEMDLVAPSGDIGWNGDVRTTDRTGANGLNATNYMNVFG